MKNVYLIVSLCMVFIAMGCSEQESEPKTQAEPAQQNSTAQQAPKQNQAATAQSNPDDKYQLPTQGKVIKALHAGGYTYMEMDNNGKRFWIAATMMNVKRNDHVSWKEGAVMQNFTSSTLRRTFDEILFVSAAEVN